MSLYELLSVYFSPEETSPQENAFGVGLDPSSSRNRTFSFGIVASTPSLEQWSVRTSNGEYLLYEGIQGAFIVFQAPLSVLSSLLAKPETHLPDRTSLMQQVKILPHDYLPQIEAFMAEAFGIKIDSSALRNNDSFPLPYRYPMGENTYLTQSYTLSPLPTYTPSKLPGLIADDHPNWVASFEGAWKMAFQNVRQPEPESGFISNFIDTAFNDNTFMWDSCFMTMFGRYGRRLFDFMGTLDNFYGKQHADGFICREINTYMGHDLFTPQDSRSTGPNILAWTEWLDYQISGNIERLRRVFPALIAYHRWWNVWRKWPDGSYWTSGWGSGMDNQSRVPNSMWHHRHYSWVDATMQQALNCEILLKIAQVIDRKDFNEELKSEYAHLSTYVNDWMWDNEMGFYFDVAPDGTKSTVKSIGAYWGLLARIIPDNRIPRMLDHLRDPQQFNRPHRVPTQSADSEGYRSDGGYWLGGVWPPTNYMLLRALTAQGEDTLAYEIASNHVENVSQVFADTGTLWENYAPESASPGNPAKPDFVGWTGISAIAIPLEYLIGLRPVAGNQQLVWDIRLTERHGVDTYPFGESNILNLVCEHRNHREDTPHITVTTKESLQLDIRWQSGQKSYNLGPGIHTLSG